MGPFYKMSLRTMNPGEKIPSHLFNATNGLNSNFDAYRGQWLILYFYPKDATPGCTTEGREFNEHYDEFKALNAVIFGISRDTLASHEKFKAKQQFQFELISDTDESICKLFDVIKMKSMYGLQMRGIERSTFLIDPEGVIKQVWRKVKVKGHVVDVLSVLKAS